MILVINKDTLKPISYSVPFTFYRSEIEFCCGFYIKDSNLQFWISQHDLDPILIISPQSNFDFIKF